MNKMKWVAMGTALIMSAGMLATPVYAEEQTNIVWAGWSGEEEANKPIFQRMMDAYRETTGNEITWVGFTWSDAAQQLLIRTQGGEQLDASQADISIFNTLAQANVLADWTDILGEDYLKENFEEAALSVGNIDGKQLGLPWSMAALTMVYNPEILSAAGWDTPPVTIDEFEQCMADIKEYDPEIIPYALSTKDTTCGADFVPWLWTNGGSIWDEEGNITVNNEAGAATLNWYKDLLDKGYITMDVGRSEARQMFAQGKVAFYDDAVVAKSQAISAGVAPDDVVNVCSAMLRPVVNEGDEPQAVQWGSMLVVYEKSENKEAVGELAKVLNSDEVALDYFTNGGMPPVTKSAAESDIVKNDAYIKTFIESTATAKLEETARMTNANEIKNILTEEIQYALLGQKDAQAALDDAAMRIESAN
jgi:multiple sugar transport system substrate-binding protein